MNAFKSVSQGNLFIPSNSKVSFDEETLFDFANPIWNIVRFKRGFVRSLTESGIDASTLLFLRFSFGILVMLVTIIITDRNLFKIKLNDFKLFIIPAICIIGINICYNEAMNNIPLSLAAVLLSSAPIFVIILASIFIKEKINSKKVISIIFVIIGCILTTGLLEGNVLNINAIGVIEGIGSAIFIAIYTVSSKMYLKEGFHTYTILFYSIIIISMILIPFTNFSQIETYVNSNISFNLIYLICIQHCHLHCLIFC